jgi:hypothetical protein
VEQPALAQRQATEGVLNPDKVARRSRLLQEHVNRLGRCDFTLLEAIAAGQFRSLRTLSNWVTSLNELA